jgi:hypothetical protein
MMFNGMQIRVGFLPEPQLMFRYTTVNIKPGFKAMFFSLEPSQGLVAKIRLCYNTHALL